MKTPVSLYDALLTAQVPADKARAVADALESDMTSTLASRQDLDSQMLLLRHDLEAGFTLVRTEFRKDIDALRAEIAALRTEVRKDIDALRTEIAVLQTEVRKDIDVLRTEIAGLRTEVRKDIDTALARQTTLLLVRFGIMLGAGLGLLFAALQLAV